ncbi:unnamed protein product [Closterium sp. NIES-54]
MRHLGVRKIIRRVLRDQGGKGRNDMHSTLAGLQASLKAHAREERKRIGRTISHLEDRVAALRQEFMADSSLGENYEELIKYEAQLKAHRDSQRRRKQTMAGVGVEMNAKKQDANVEEWPMDPLKTLDAEAKQGLSAPWSEEEVGQAMRELPRGKAPGAYGLPKELLEESVMDFMREFEQTAKLPRSASTAVTILQHKKGERTDLGNYIPITLLSATYKIVAKLLSNIIYVMLV